MDSSGKDLFIEQVEHLHESHFLVLFWAAQAEDRRLKYNITNAFDDLKAAGITRTKQNAVAILDALAALRFLQLRGEANRRHIYLSPHGGKALEYMAVKNKFTPRKSAFLEGLAS